MKRHLLFICSGNTCRSPMAEYLMRSRLPADSGWSVGSAGTSTVEGLPMATNARKALSEIDIDASRDQGSRLLTAQMVAEATVIVVMGRHHADRVVELAPGCHDKVFTLRRFAARATGEDVADPIGGTLYEYRGCRDTITECLPRLQIFLEELG